MVLKSAPLSTRTCLSSNPREEISLGASRTRKPRIVISLPPSSRIEDETSKDVRVILDVATSPNLGSVVSEVRNCLTSLFTILNPLEAKVA